uniref:Uncharacterized protein n=1 Tax=Triticum urartu TaxID=4572 RepID=A0A8R7PN36_TRIUA
MLILGEVISHQRTTCASLVATFEFVLFSYICFFNKVHLLNCVSKF